MTQAKPIPVEVERKFRVVSDGFRDGARTTSIRQGYLARGNANTVRVRIEDTSATLTIKTRSEGITSPEFEYEIPLDHAEFLLGQCEGSVIEKTRHRVAHEHHTWEIDEFFGDNAGLIVAEIELESEDEAFAKPNWLGPEVTYDKRFKNSRLCIEPYNKSWAETNTAEAPIRDRES